MRDFFVIQVKILFSTYKFLSTSTFIGTLSHFCIQIKDKNTYKIQIYASFTGTNKTEFTPIELCKPRFVPIKVKKKQFYRYELQNCLKILKKTPTGASAV